MILRDYQSEALAAVESGWSECARQLVVMPTGAGKTILFAHLAARSRPQRTLILAHREELIDQAIGKLLAATGIFAEKEKAEFEASRRAEVVVASVQTMIRRLDRWPADHFGLVVADEAHHALSDSWRRVIDHFTPARLLGVTATPDRGDRRNLGEVFDRVAYEVGLFDLVNAGYLSPISVQSVPLSIDLTAVRSTAGDFNDADLGSALEPYLGAIAEAIALHASFRRVLAFLPLRATSHKFVEACRGAGLSAEHIDGESPDRRELLERFRSWDFDVLSNAMLLNEGYDDPGIDCVVVLRPTRSRPLYAQMVGRGTRVSDHKRDLLLLDFLWHHERHKLVRPAHLIARSEEEAEAMTALSQSQALPGDVAEQMPLDLRTVATAATAERERALRQRLEEQRNKAARSISAEEFAMRHDALAVAEYEPTMKWEREAVTQKQRPWLEKAGIDVESVRGKGHAAQLLGLFFGRPKLATWAQRFALRKMGHPGWETATEPEARRAFAARRGAKHAVPLGD